MTALALMMGSAALAVGTPAGTLIQNQATMNFTTEGGADSEIPSDSVVTRVLPVCSPSVLPNGTVPEPGQKLNMLAGQSGWLKYTLTNAGNTSSTFNLSTNNETASQFTPSTLTVYQDTNANGVLDAGEEALSSVTLSADQTVNLLVKVDTLASARGNAFVNLVASCVTDVSGTPTEQDGNNVSQVTLDEPPAFTLEKSFTAAVVRPGADTVVNITARNNGGTAREVTITDFLNTAAMRDFVFVSGSARVSGSAAGSVIEYTAGNDWNTTETAPVAGIRSRTPSVPAGGTITLSFTLRPTEAALGTYRNVAQLVTDGQTLDASAEVVVKYEPQIALGPINNPEARPGGELSADDLQRKTATVLNQEICFSHTLQNLGDRDDVITTTASVQKGAASVRFKDMNGNLIAEPFKVTLAPGAKTDFQACYTPTAAGQGEALRVLLTSVSANGAASNSTVDVIGTVGPGLSAPVKSVDKGSSLVTPGETITYTLQFTNNQAFALNNVFVKDDLNNITRGCLGPTRTSGNLSAAQSVTTQTMTKQNLSAQATTLLPLEFVSAEPGGVLQGNVVVWKFPTVQPGQTVTMRLSVRVPASTPDCATITNQFTVSSDEVPTPVRSNDVVNTVFNNANFDVTKTSVQSTVVVGEQITYILTVKNSSASMPLTQVKVDDTFPAGLKYVQGSSTLDGAPITPSVTTVDGREVLSWNIPGLAAGASAEIRYRALVTPEASTNLKNSVVVTAVASDRIVKTPEKVNNVKIQPLSFGPNNADIVGYVFVDRNRNGIYDYGKDTPVHNARVILANGRIELTDTEGRYHYRNVREGEWALRLDPNSVWQQNLRINPQEAGREGSRLVYVRNLTSVDFPLAPDAGDIAVIRDTRLTMTAGPKGGTQQQFNVHKQVFQTNRDTTLYTVQLNLTACDTLKAFTLTDPLPAGATLVNGQNTLNIDPLPNGERTLVYQFRFDGDVKAAVTDPTATWRY